MRRPLALVGFTYLLALVTAVYFGESAALILAVLSFVLFLVTICIKSCRANKAMPVAFAVAAVAFCVYAVYSVHQIKPVQSFDNRDATISGVICELPYKSYNRYYYVIQTDSVDLQGAPQSMKVRVSASHALEADVYDRVQGRVHLFLPSGGETGFSSQSYYESKGIYMLAYLYDYEDVQVTSTVNRPLYYYALKGRQAMLTALRILLPPEQASLAGGILLGDKQSLSEQVTTDFRDIGVSHLLAVSGLHTAMIGQILMLFFLFLKIPKKLSAVLSMSGLLCFMAVTGFTPSVVRAGIMSIVYLAGILFSRKSDALNSLGISVLILTVGNPAAAGDVGLLLSFSATLGLILLCDKIDAWFRNKTDKLRYGKGFIKGVTATISSTLAATLFTLPIVILTFGQISTVSILANILLVFPSTVMMLCAAMAALLSFTGMFQFLAMPFALITGVLNNYLAACAHLLADIPFAAVSVTQSFVLLWLAATLVLIAVAFYLRKDLKMLKTVSLLSVILLLTGVFSYQLSMRNVTQLAVLQTGDGCSVVVTKGRHAAVLCCGGSGLAASEVQGFLRARNCKQLDYMLLPQIAEEASSGAAGVLQKYHSSALLYPEDDSMDENLARSVEQNGNSYLFANKVQSKVWGEIDLSVVAADKASFTVVRINGIAFLICPAGGDVSSLTREERVCDFFIAGKLPQNSSSISAAYTILSMEEETVADTWSHLSTENGNPILTATQGNILIDTYSNGTVCIRREK